MIKLVVIDLDGTLLDDTKKVSLENRESIAHALRQGMNVSISTGRSYISGHEYVESLGLAVPVSYQNGAMVLKESNGIREIFNAVTLRKSVAVELVKLARLEKITSIVFKDFFNTPDMMMEQIPKSSYSDYYWHSKSRISIQSRPEDFVTGDGIPEVALEGPEDTILSIVDRIQYPDGMSVIKNNTIDTHSFYEFFGAGVGKMNGLKHIAGHFGISSDEVAYIGDNFNDIDIMNGVGFSIAMSNAPDMVKKHAKFVTDRDNNESGVAQAIEQILRGEF